MTGLGINITVSSLSDLAPAPGSNNYYVDLEFLNSSNAPLGNPNIPNTHTAIVNTTVLTFTAKVPITDGTYVIPNVTVKAYGNLECCVASKVITIYNNGGEEEEGDLLFSGFFARD